MSDWHKELIEANLREHSISQDKRRRAQARIDRVIASMLRETDRLILREILDGAVDRLRREDEELKQQSRRRSLS